MAWIKEIKRWNFWQILYIFEFESPCKTIIFPTDVKLNDKMEKKVIRHMSMSFTITYQNQRLSRACIVHLVIKKNNWSYVKTMSCSGSHLGITINIKNTKFVKDFPMIDAQFRFNQCNSFREEYISVFSPYGPVLILWPVVAAILDFRSA